ncbi:putative ribonuclease H-like domain-containing protein [Tanacetum coccineum]
MKDSCDDPLEDNPLRFKLFRKTELERNCPKALQCRDASRYTVRVRGYCIWSQCYHDHSYTEENKKDTEYYRQNKIGGPRVLTEEGIDYDEVFAPVARIEAIRNKKDIMLVQVYVDDIIFGSTNKSWCDEFEALMQSRFQMSSMGELTFFLGLQVKQNKGGIFISQDKYVAEILKKFDLVNVKAAITPMETKYVHLYRSMIGSLMYLTASRPDIMYAVCVCSRFQVTPKTSHLNAVKRIFKYLKGKPHLGLWYPRESPFDLEAFSDSDYGGSNLDRKSTTGGCQFLGQRLISWQWFGEISAIVNTKADGSLEINATIDTIRYTISEASIRDSLQLEDATGITMLPNDELFEGMGQIGYPTDGTFTFWKSFFTPQWRYLVHHLLHCISSKSGGWDQFGSNIATALICLSTGRVYNFSKLIFDGMVANLKSKTKFLMYPRFLQMILNIQTEDKHLYLAVSLTKKIFGNMKRGFRGAPRPLLPSMLLVATNPNAGQEHDAVAPSQPSSSTPQVPSQPSTPTPPPIPTPTPPPIPTPTPPPIPTPTPIPDPEPTPFEHIFEEPSPVHHPSSPPQEQAPSQMPVDDLLHEVPKLISRIDSLEMDLKQTKLTMGNAIVKLVKKVKKLEGFLKRRNLVLSDSEEEEPEAQGRKSQDDPQDSSVQGLVTPSTTKVKASGEEQEEDISPNTLEAAKTLSKVASLKTRSIDKGRRYKRRKEAKGKKVVSSLDFQEEADAGAEQVNTASAEQVSTAEGINTGSIKLSTGDEQLSTGNEQVSTVGAKKSTSDQDKGKREGKSPMINEETPKKSKEQVLQEEASLAEAISTKNCRRKELTEQQKKRKLMYNLRGLSIYNEDWIWIRAISLKLSMSCQEHSWKQFENDFVKDHQTKTPKATEKDKDDEAKDDEPTKKSGKRRKQIARKGMHTSVDKNDSEDSDKVGEQEENVTGTETPINLVPVAMKTPSVATYKIIKQGEKGDNELYGMDGPEDKLEKGFWKCLRIMFEEPLTINHME